MAEPNLPEVFVDAFERADRTLAAGWYHSVSVGAEPYRRWLRSRRLPFLDPEEATAPPLVDLDHTAGLVIARAARSVGALGAVAGMGGLATIPSEWVAANVAALRMAQRLCVVYGFDPGDDRGQMALCRVLAHAYEVDLPPNGLLELRVSHLPGLVWSGARLDEVPGRLVRAMARSSAWWVAGRITRAVPVLSAGTHAAEARRAMEEAGGKMQQLLRRLAEAPEQAALDVEEAHELSPRRG